MLLAGGRLCPTAPAQSNICSKRTALLTDRGDSARVCRRSLQLPAAPRRSGLLCLAAKRPGSKKKSGPKQQGSKGSAKAAVKEQPKAPASAPAQGSTSTKERSAQRHEEEQAKPQQEQAQPEADPAPVQAATQQVAEPGAPADSGDARRQQQEQALSESAEPELKAADLRRQLQQQQQEASQKPNLLEGVLREVQLIEWPSIPSALLNTVLVIAIVAGFSILLFAVNSLLAETSQVLYGGLKDRPEKPISVQQPASAPSPAESAPKKAPQPKASAPAAPPAVEPSKKFADLGPE